MLKRHYVRSRTRLPYNIRGLTSETTSHVINLFTRDLFLCLLGPGRGLRLLLVDETLTQKLKSFIFLIGISQDRFKIKLGNPTPNIERMSGFRTNWKRDTANYLSVSTI